MIHILLLLFNCLDVALLVILKRDHLEDMLPETVYLKLGWALEHA